MPNRRQKASIREWEPHASVKDHSPTRQKSCSPNLSIFCLRASHRARSGEPRLPGGGRHRKFCRLIAADPECPLSRHLSNANQTCQNISKTTFMTPTDIANASCVQLNERYAVAKWIADRQFSGAPGSAFRLAHLGIAIVL